MFRRVLMAGVACFCAAAPAQAQNQCGILNTDKCGLTSASARAAEAVLNPQAAAAPAARVAAGMLGKLIGDLDINFKTFSTDDADQSGIGFDYDWNKRMTRWVLSDSSANVSGFSWNLSANGNVAFDEDTNPKDFLKSATTLGWLVSRGGVSERLPRETAQRLQAIVLELTDVPTDSLANHPLNQEALHIISRNLSTQLFVSLDAQLAYETNQSFDQRQLAYGGRVGLDVKAWNPNSALAQFNVLDWPFAVLRYLTGADSDLQPRGSALPTFLLALEQVNPEEDTARARLDALDAYPRVSVEAGFRTLAGKLMNGALYAEANLRYYQELGASDVVKAANIDDAFLLVVALTGPAGSYVSYSTGELPFDRRSDKVYELGFRYKF